MSQIEVGKKFWYVDTSTTSIVKVTVKVVNLTNILLYCRKWHKKIWKSHPLSVPIRDLKPEALSLFDNEYSALVHLRADQVQMLANSLRDVENWRSNIFDIEERMRELQ